MMKTPSNAYRASFLRALFPNARVQVLHLTRNPAAAINGLVDVAISGFSRSPAGTAPCHRGGPSATGGSTICHPAGRTGPTEASLRWPAFSGDPPTRTSSRPGRRCYRSASRTSWVQPNGDLREHICLDGRRPRRIHARGHHRRTAPRGHRAARQRRWFARAELLGPVLADPEVNEVAESLGYTDRADWT